MENNERGEKKVGSSWWLARGGARGPASGHPPPILSSPASDHGFRTLNYVRAICTITFVIRLYYVKFLNSLKRSNYQQMDE